MGIKAIWKGAKWAAKNRKNINLLKEEIMQVQRVVISAKEDDRITPAEMRLILAEVNDVCDIFIDLLETKGGL